MNLPLKEVCLPLLCPSPLTDGDPTATSGRNSYFPSPVKSALTVEIGNLLQCFTGEVWSLHPWRFVRTLLMGVHQQ